LLVREGAPIVGDELIKGFGEGFAIGVGDDRRRRDQRGGERDGGVQVVFGVWPGLGPAGYRLRRRGRRTPNHYVVIIRSVSFNDTVDREG